jgi:hypothetical protein
MATSPAADGIFGAKVSGGDSEEVARLKAELQVEKDRHRVLVDKAHRVEKTQAEKDSAAALQLLETLEDLPASQPKA